MLVSYNLLKEYVDFDIPVEDLSSKLTMQGLEVEGITQIGGKIDNLKVGIIKKMEKHPQADKLTVCQVDDGQLKQIICGASNMKEGDKVCVAQLGANLPNGVSIKKAKMRGVDSEGMLCSKEELNVLDTSSSKEKGIWILPEDAQIGSSMDIFLSDKDYILNLALTSNRGDCLSTVGVAREIAAMTKKHIIYKKNTFKIASNIEKPSIDIKDADLCPRYVSRIIKNVKITESPDWMKEYLVKLGSKPINNIVDITNYVLFEYGHPLHAFDLDTLKDKKIIVRRAKKGEKITLIDEIERELEPEMLVIADTERPVALAGVMGGKDTEISDKTTNVLLESAYFIPSTIRKTSKKFGLSTEASYRFERDTDYFNLDKALDRCIQLITELAGGEVSEITDVNKSDKKPAKINISVEFVNHKLGTKLTSKEIVDILKPMEFTIIKEDKEKIELQVPTCKTDVIRPIDVVEEIVRIYGYNIIEENNLPIYINENNLVTKLAIEEKIKDALIHSGLYEVVNYSFFDTREVKKLGLYSDEIIDTLNPISSDNESMRNNLFVSLLTNLIYNINYGNRNIKIFEIGDTYYKTLDKSTPFAQARKLGILLYGAFYEKDIYSVERKDRDVDIFDIKGILEVLFEKLGEAKILFEPIDDSANEPLYKILNTGKSAIIKINNINIGFIGEVGFRIKKEYKLNKNLVVCEIDVNKLKEINFKESTFNEISKFQKVKRDLSIIIKEDISSQRVLSEIKKASQKITEINIVDIYKGEHIQEGFKSLSFSFTFQDLNKTLTDEEVNNEYYKIVDKLKDKLSAQMRDK